jgi:hypothetical protein
LGKFPARPSNKSRFLLWPCKIATSLFDPNFIFLPFHGPAVTSAVNFQSSDCEKIIVPLAHKQQILRSHGEQILKMYSMILTADVTAGPWKGRKMKSGSNKEVAILQGHRR